LSTAVVINRYPALFHFKDSVAALKLPVCCSLLQCLSFRWGTRRKGVPGRWWSVFSLPRVPGGLRKPTSISSRALHSSDGDRAGKALFKPNNLPHSALC
jgi:hypothetical protein